MESRRGTAGSYLGLDDSDPSTAAWVRKMRSGMSYAAVLRKLRAGEGVDACGLDRVRALYIVAMIGAMKQLKQLLEDGADYTLKCSMGFTAVHIAHLRMQTEVVNYLLVHEALVQELSIQLERTPTMDEIYVAMNAEEFHAFRSNVKACLEDRSAQFVEAARSGDFACVQAMLHGGEVDVDAVLHLTGETAFSAALGSEDYRICDYLLDNGAHTHAPCIVQGKTQSTLLKAVRNGNVELVERLARLKVVSANDTQDRDTCPMIESLESGSISMVDRMIKMRASLYNPAMTQRLRLPSIVDFDLNSFSARDRFLWVILCLATWLENQQLVEGLMATRRTFQERKVMATDGAHALSVFLNRGASIHHRVFNDESPLTAAVAIDSVPMLHFLIQRGADIHATYAVANGGSLLSRSILFGASNCTRALLGLETRPEQRDKALAAATKCGDLDVLRLLLDEALPSTADAFAACVEATSCPWHWICSYRDAALRGIHSHPSARCSSWRVLHARRIYWQSSSPTVST